MKQLHATSPLWLLMLAACASQPAIPRQAGKDMFLIERDLVGDHIARGEFRTITGLRRGFTARLAGSWDGTTLTLVEDFEFDDGERDRKTWQLERTGPGEFVGTREDVVGKARGFQDGNVFRLEYNIVLASDKGQGRKVRFRDVLALASDKTIVNDATVGWMGFKVGSVSLNIRDMEAPDEDQHTQQDRETE